MQEKNSLESRNIINTFLLNVLEKGEWPFSLELAEDVFALNKYGDFLSLKDFFLSKELNPMDLSNPIYPGEEEEEEEEEEGEEGDRGLKDWQICKKYPDFIIKDNNVFFLESALRKNVNSGTLEEKEADGQLYRLDSIPYEIIIFSASKFYIENYLEEYIIDPNQIKDSTIIPVWRGVFYYLILTNHYLLFKRLIEESKYMETFKKQMIFTFYAGFEETSYITNHSSMLYSSPQSKERLLALFTIANCSKNVSERQRRLVDDCLSTKDLTEIIAFFKEQDEKCKDL